MIFRAVHFPAELAAAPAVCMLRWLSKEGTLAGVDPVEAVSRSEGRKENYQL